MPLEFDWATVATVTRPEEGSGVLFADLRDGTRVVIKGTMNVAAEIFGSLFAVACGLTVPETRLVTWPDTEWHQLKGGVFRATEPESAIRRAAEHLLDRTVLLVQRFVPKTAPFYCPGLFRHTDELLEAVGRLVAVDVVLNNYDRLPCGDVWSNCGNLNNVLVDRDTGALIAIDTLFVSTTKPALHVAKIQRVAANPEHYADKIWHFLLNSGFDGAAISDPPAAVLRGLVSGLDAASALAPHLPALKAFVARSLVKQDWENVWAMSCAALRDDFIGALAESLAPTTTAAAVDWSAVHTSWTAPQLRTTRSVSSQRLARLHIVAVQGPCRGGAEARRLLQSLPHPRPHVIVFAECDAVVNNELRALTEEFAPLLIVAGTYSQRHQTAGGGAMAATQVCEVLHGGATVLRYRKRNLHDGVVSFDDNPPFVDVSFDADLQLRLGVAICRDMESRDVVADLVATRPQLVVNPSYISGDAAGRGADLSDDSVARWRGSLAGAASKFEWLAKANGWVHIRTDWAASAGGSGVTQVFSCVATHSVASPDALHLCAAVPIEHFSVAAAPPQALLGFAKSVNKPRSTREDDVGKRVVTHTVLVPDLKASSAASAHFLDAHHILVLHHEGGSAMIAAAVDANRAALSPSGVSGVLGAEAAQLFAPDCDAAPTSMAVGDGFVAAVVGDDVIIVSAAARRPQRLRIGGAAAIAGIVRLEAAGNGAATLLLLLNRSEWSEVIAFPASGGGEATARRLPCRIGASMGSSGRGGDVLVIDADDASVWSLNADADLSIVRVPCDVSGGVFVRDGLTGHPSLLLLTAAPSLTLVDFSYGGCEEPPSRRFFVPSDVCLGPGDAATTTHDVICAFAGETRLRLVAIRRCSGAIEGIECDAGSEASCGVKSLTLGEPQSAGTKGAPAACGIAAAFAGGGRPTFLRVAAVRGGALKLHQFEEGRCPVTAAELFC